MTDLGPSGTVWYPTSIPAATRRRFVAVLGVGVAAGVLVTLAFLQQCPAHPGAFTMCGAGWPNAVGPGVEIFLVALASSFAYMQLARVTQIGFSLAGISLRARLGSLELRWTDIELSPTASSEHPYLLRWKLKGRSWPKGNVPIPAEVARLIQSRPEFPGFVVASR